MFKKTTFMALVGTSALFLSTAGIAGTYNSRDIGPAPVNTGSGYFISGNIGYGKVKETISNANTDNSGFVYNFNGGYRFNKNFGLELGYTSLPNVKANGRSVAKENSIIDIAAIGRIPFANGFNVFGKAGLARVHTNYVDTLTDTDGKIYNGDKVKIAPYLGIGAGYAVTQNVELDVQVAGTPKQDTVPAMYAVTGGVAYIF